MRDRYEDYNKPDLVATLDNHLIANRSTFVNDARLADYYRRQSQPARFGTPAKRAARVEVMSSPSAAEESSSRSTRRRTAVRPEVKREETTDESSGDGDEASENGSKARTTTYVSDPVGCDWLSSWWMLTCLVRNQTLPRLFLMTRGLLSKRPMRSLT